MARCQIQLELNSEPSAVAAANSRNPVVAFRNRELNKTKANFSSNQHTQGIFRSRTASRNGTRNFRSSLRFPPAGHIRIKLRGLFAGHGQRSPIPRRAGREMLRHKNDLPHVV
jgi:hypothetical protein